MPQDAPPASDNTRIEAIRADLSYYKKACAAAHVGGQPPTIYAAKYADDVEFLLGLVDPSAQAAEPAKPSELEVALTHDEAGRVERKPKRG